MKDYFGNELAVGDEVAFCAPQYRMMVTGKVLSFTAKQVRVTYVNTWNYGTPGRVCEYLNYPEMFVKKMTTNPVGREVW